MVINSSAPIPAKDQLRSIQENKKYINVFSYDDLFGILDSVCDSVAVMDPNGIVVWINNTISIGIGMSKEEAIGQHVSQAVREGRMDRSIVLDAIRTGQSTSGVVHMDNGVEFLVRCHPLYDQDGKIKFFVSTSSSLLELNQLWNSLQDERRKSAAYSQELEKLRKKLLLETDALFVGSAMQNLLGDIKKISPMNSTVLITGESGVGKEVVAKTIHNNSLRKDNPFVPVCIPALPENLLEAELFGYEEGAFTGSQRGGKMGLFEIAQGGTLFLDEIGDMPLNMQVKILRAIEYGEIRRVGGTNTIRLNVRILAATNKDLPGMITRGEFREDLFYRLNVIQIHVKALRDRRDVIAPLVLQFIKNFSKEYSTPKTISREALELLEEYSWPGNVRELKNIVERLAIFSHGSVITDREVEEVLANAGRMHFKTSAQIVAADSTSPSAVTGSNTMHKSASKSIDFAPEADLSPAQAYRAFEKNRILEALKEADGNKSKAAQILGMSRSRLYRKLEKM